MSIFLPENLTSFRQAFDETCSRIYQSNQDEIFYFLLVQLTVAIRRHPFFKGEILSFEREYLKKQNEFSNMALEFHEYNWKMLWKWHKRSYRARKELATIKRLVTLPIQIESSPLHTRFGARMWQFRYHSSLFRILHESLLLFRKAQFETHLWPSFAQHFSSLNETVTLKRTIRQLRLKKMDKISKVSLQIINLIKKKNTFRFKWVANSISSLFSPLGSELEHRFGFPGNNKDEKWRNMLIKAETAFPHCWERFQCLEKCYNMSPVFIALKRFQGKWKEIKNLAWCAAWERCENEALQYAQMSLRKKMFSPSNDEVDSFLPVEMLFSRKNYEKLLTSLKNHVHAHLYKIEKVDHKTDISPSVGLSVSLKHDFIIKLAKQYWIKHPKATHDDVFENYQCTCPFSHQLQRDSWNLVVRKHNVDPRPKDQKKRQSGRKDP